MLKGIARWMDERLGAAAFAESALNKVFPNHWSFLLGEIAAYCFIILILTGTFLTFFFDPSVEKVTYDGAYEALKGVDVSQAYASVVEISYDVRVGLLMRQMHHWAALIFIAAVVVHLVRVFFTGAFRRPRELNWMIGLTLLLLSIFNGFTGYSLPDDLLSGTGLRIAHSITLSIPLVGTGLSFLIFGGEFPADEIISRLYVIHVLLIPGAMLGLLAAHLAIVWRQKHTQFPGPGKTEDNVVGEKLWPTYAAKSAGLFFMILAVVAALGGLAQINPVWLYGPFEPSAVSSPAQPDWYFGWIEGALRLFPNWEIRAFGYMVPNPFFPAVLLPGITVAVLYAWPFIEARLTGDRDEHELLDRPRDRPVRTALGVAAFSFYLVMFLAASNDYIARTTDTPIGAVTNTFRVLLFVLPVATGFATHRLMRRLAALR